jgi:hypothetical protein
VVVISSPVDAPGGSAFNVNKVQLFSAESNACSRGLNSITSAKVAEQIMDNVLRFADASSHHASNLGKDMATTQPTTDRKCKSAALESNGVIQSTLQESLKCAAITHAESCPSQFKDINGYTNQGLREKDVFNHSNSSAFSRYVIEFKYLFQISSSVSLSCGFRLKKQLLDGFVSVPICIATRLVV